MFSLRNDIRGSRKTRQFATALACVVIGGTALVFLTMAWGVFSSLRAVGGESIELMSIDAAAAASTATADLAPSRLAPKGPTPGTPAPIEPAVAAAEAALVVATQDQGPSLGTVQRAADRVAASTPTFNGRPLRAVKTVRMLTTAYSPDEKSCGIWADGITASGYSVWTNGMKLVAADTSLFPFGTVLTIPGYNDGRPVPVLDRGGRIKGHRLDVLYPTHEIALVWGAQRLDVTVWEYAD